MPDQKVHESPTRVPELDLLRFLAATAVVLYHFVYRPTIHGGVSTSVFGPSQEIARFGYMGVNLFFMISGFVILWSSQGRSPSEFAASRIARLFPSFWVCVLLTAFVVNAAGADHVPLRTVAANLTMVPNLAGVPYVDAVYWTLFVELKFYLLVFVLLVTGTMNHVERWLGLWLGTSLACALGLAPGWIASAAMYPYGPYFISGCLIYLARAKGFSVYRAALLTIAGVLATWYAIQQQSAFARDVTPTTSWVTAGAIVVFHLAFIAIALKPTLLPPTRWWYLLGSLTYPLYLLHARVGKTLWSQLPRRWSAWLSLAVVLLSIYLLTALVAWTTERRLCGMLHRVLVRSLGRLPSLRSSAA